MAQRFIIPLTQEFLTVLSCISVLGVPDCRELFAPKHHRRALEKYGLTPVFLRLASNSWLSRSASNYANGTTLKLLSALMLSRPSSRDTGYVPQPLLAVPPGLYPR